MLDCIPEKRLKEIFIAEIGTNHHRLVELGFVWHRYYSDSEYEKLKEVWTAKVAEPVYTREDIAKALGVKKVDYSCCWIPKGKKRFLEREYRFLVRQGKHNLAERKKSKKNYVKQVPIEQREILSIAALAVLMGSSKTSLEWHIKKGRLPAPTHPLTGLAGYGYTHDEARKYIAAINAWKGQTDGLVSVYRLASMLDRNIATVFYWNKHGKIPPATHKARGRLWWTEEEAKSICKEIND